MHLGNLEFDVVDDKTGPEVQNDPEDTENVGHICELLGIESDALRRVFRCKKFFDPVSKNVLLTPLRVEQARQVKLSIARVLYSRMFDWIVNKINTSMKRCGSDHEDPKFKDAPKADKNLAGTMIGLLDIYGFEVFE